jgi:hypothetical protein
VHPADRHLREEDVESVNLIEYSQDLCIVIPGDGEIQQHPNDGNNGEAGSIPGNIG